MIGMLPYMKDEIMEIQGTGKKAGKETVYRNVSDTFPYVSF